jgi:hypothetical protein
LCSHEAIYPIFGRRVSASPKGSDRNKECGIIENKNITLRNVKYGEISGVKNGKKNDCLTGFHVEQQIHPNLGNTVKNCAPITSLGESTTVFS